MSTMSCIPASTRSNAPLYPARVPNNVSVAALSGNSPGTSCVETAVAASLAMISRQSSTHSSQMNTPGPETSVFTSVCAFPQNEQPYTRFGALIASASGMILLSLVNLRMTVNHMLTADVNLSLTTCAACRGHAFPASALRLQRQLDVNISRTYMGSKRPSSFDRDRTTPSTP